MSEKSTNAEIEQRVNKVYELLVCSWTYYDILRYASDNWNISDRQTDNYIARAKEIIKENAKQTQEEWLEDTKNKLIDLYKKNMSMKELGECRRLLETANKVLGYEKLDVNVNIVSEQEKRELRDILDKARESYENN